MNDKKKAKTRILYLLFDQNWSLAENFRQIIVVDTKFCEEDFIFYARITLKQEKKKESVKM
jgi:hypothetical protein